jgi:large subunit ribosomal protein L31e
MATLERTYNVPLRKEFVNTPKYKRSKKAVTALKTFIAKNMKSDDVKIGKHLNEFIWENGIKNPPHHVKVQLVKDDEGVVRAELFGAKYDEPTKEERQKASESKAKASKEEKVSEKVKQKPELVDQALKNPKGLKEEVQEEEAEEKLEQEEKLSEEVTEEKEDIQEGLDEIKEPVKPKAKKAKPSN